MKSMSRVIVPQADRFSHREAMEVYNVALTRSQSERIVIDLARAQDATSAAFAQLVLLRRALRGIGRDLCLTNLHDRAAHMYHLHRLDDVLPNAESSPI